MDNSNKQKILRYAELSCKEQLLVADQRELDAEEKSETLRILTDLNMTHGQVIDLAVRNVVEEVE